MAAKPITPTVSVIEHHTSLKGDISFQNTLVINGTFRGTIKGGKLLTIEKDGVVNAEISVQSVLIKGTVEGTIRTTELTHIFAGSKVKGRIATHKLQIEDGASFQGQCEMKHGTTDAKDDAASTTSG